MKTVLLVDDELPARELLKLLADWTACGFSTIYEARDGSEALQLYLRHRPDLIITDIQMPKIDGLELIRAVLEVNSAQKIVILSCHESFAYARQAIGLGVLDYLIKDALTTETLEDLLLTVSAETKTAPPKPQSTCVGEAFGVLTMALDAAVPQERISEEMSRRFARGREYFCCAVRLNDDALVDSNVYEQVAREIGRGGADVRREGNGRLIVLADAGGAYSRQAATQRRFALIQHLRAALSPLSSRDASIGVSGSHPPEFPLRQAIGEAEHALLDTVFLGKGKTLYFDPERSRKNDVQGELLSSRISGVSEAVDRLDEPRMKAELTALYEKDLRGMMQYNYLRHINTVLLGILTTACTHDGIPYRDVFATDTVTSEMLDELETVKELRIWFEQRFSALISRLLHREKNERSPRVQRIIDFINANYRDDLGLDGIADHFGLHKVHLSRIFKRETGASVNEYIHLLRIEKAKELLRGHDISISGIVGLVGYNSPQSFFSAFKRQVGTSPGDYRASCIARRNRE